MPVFVYLGVLVLAFGIQYPPAVFATIVYAIRRPCGSPTTACAACQS